MRLTTTQADLQEVYAWFTNNDHHLGYRRLLDLAIDTDNATVYEETLQFCDWYDDHQQATDHPELLIKVDSLLQLIGNTTPPPAIDTTTPRLRAAGLGKRYTSGSFALSNINLSLYPGGITGLVGENGNGKTTLLRLLYGELAPDSGTIEYKLNNVPPGAGPYDIKTRLAFIAQRPDPWYGSLMENLQFTASHYGFKGRRNILWTEMICARMGLRAFRTFNWNKISSGYKMRFELARTLLKKPEVLLLDEPLANLDVLAQQVILEDLRFLALSKHMPMAVILSSQQLYEVEKVSREVIFLKQGQPKYQDTSPDSKREGLIIELETSASRDELQSLFTPLGLTQVSFNGGVYLLHFTEAASLPAVLMAIGQEGISVRYLRDISSSSRRFFQA